MNTNYSLIILNVPEVMWYFKNNIGGIYNEYSLTITEKEHLYDWLIIESLDKIFRHFHKTTIYNHYRHDVYKCIYDIHGYNIQSMVLDKLDRHKLSFMKGEEVKVIVLAENILIGRGVK